MDHLADGMTERQTAVHWRLWGEVCGAQGWRIERGRLKVPAEPSNLYARQVLETAQELARGASRPMKLDDLRHATYIRACELDSLRLIGNPRDFTRLAAYLRLLLDDTDLDAAEAWVNKDADTRRRYVWGIRNLRVPHAYIEAICRDRFDAIYTSPFWEDLPLAALSQLLMTLKQRMAAQAAVGAVAQPLENAETAADPNPF